MQDIQVVFNRIQEAKKKQKDLKAAYKEALANSMDYHDVSDKIKTLNQRRKQIEQTIKESFSSELTKIEDLQIDIASDTEVLSDIAVTTLMKGETVEIEDQYGNKYDPVLLARFKKA